MKGWMTIPNARSLDPGSYVCCTIDDIYLKEQTRPTISTYINSPGIFMAWLWP